MTKKLTIAVALLAAAAAAFAADEREVANKIALKDGSTVYIFKNGKMAMEDRVGRPMKMQPGHPMETTDGKRIIMVGNELARLENLQMEHKGGGGQ